MNSSVHLIDDQRPGGVMTNLRALLEANTRGASSHSIGFVNARYPLSARSLESTNIIVHFSISWAKLPYLLALRILNPQARLILQEHHYSPEHFAGLSSERSRFRVLLKVVSLLFDRIVAVSGEQARWYNSMGLKPDAVIPPLANIKPLFKLPARTNTGRPVVGISGRLDTTKGIDLALELLQLPAARSFDFVFAGYGELAGKVVEAAQTYPNVSFIGPYDRVEEYLIHCDVVLIPSRLDTFGLAALEAKAAGKPIVVANTCGLAGQATDCGVIVKTGCPKALASGLQHLFDTGRLVELGRSARRAATRHNPNALKQWSLELSGN